MSTQKTVFVGLSGGVDSSVAALRLIRQGYTVVGVFIKVWQPDFLHCNWEAERLDAMRVAAHLGIPFLTFDAVDAYKQGVADYLIAEYQAGRTPNPDVMCNKHVKFGAFLSYARSMGAHAVATGHYARIIEHNGQYQLLRGTDKNKDQSYFLWSLTQNELPHILFPIGDTEKSDVRREAEAAGLPTFAKRDSQGICFLGQIDMKEFLSHYINENPGNVLNEEGNIIGTHRGALFYTLGERHGFTHTTNIPGGNPQYVIRKDILNNTITVGPEQLAVGASSITLNAVSFTHPWSGDTCMAQFRYRQTAFPIHILEMTSGYVKLVTDGVSVDMPSPGQSCVLYDGDVCLGGGIIS